jgi:hypothetical protein
MIASPSAKLAIMTVLRAFIIGAVLAGCLAGPVSAQSSRKGPSLPATPGDLEKRKEAEAIDKQYKATLERTRKDTVVTPPADPWGGIRGGDDSKTKR